MSKSKGKLYAVLYKPWSISSWCLWGTAKEDRVEECVKNFKETYGDIPYKVLREGKWKG